MVFGITFHDNLVNKGKPYQNYKFQWYYFKHKLTFTTTTKPSVDDSSILDML